MNEQQLQAIKERVAKAKEGPWNVGLASPNGFENVGSKGSMVCQVYCSSDGNLNKNTAEFIARARQDVPALLEHIETLQTKVNNQAKQLNQQCTAIERLKETKRKVSNIAARRKDEIHRLKGWKKKRKKMSDNNDKHRTK